MRFVLEVDDRLFEFPEPLHEAFLVGIDQDIVDGGVLEQCLDRAEPRHLVDDFFGERKQLSLIESQPLGPCIFANIVTHLACQIFTRELFERNEIELIDDAFVQLNFFIEQRWALFEQLMIVVIEELLFQWAITPGNLSTIPPDGLGTGLFEKAHISLSISGPMGTLRRYNVTKYERICHAQFQFPRLWRHGECPSQPRT